ncbi:MAG: SRPBCC family protein [Coleofasciculus sp. B1-GNL1-01]|uniref:SRPBCC family protein n=1 Tax=Coleofasciculus sp. B1-GNL1-01 TaxID=3068484 RepID=UPI0032FB9145
MLHYRKSTLIDAPVEVVWNFHERPDILERLTPPWQPVQVVRREGGLGVGAISEFRLFVGPIPLRWVAIHIECEPYSIFTDKQKEGPMAYWVHRHQFNPEAGKTRLTDRIEYGLPGGWLVERLLDWWVDAQLEQLFSYRHQVTQTECSRIGEET